MTNMLFIVALTLWGEARGEGEEGMRMVASVIWNRAENRDQTFDDVCTQPKQFSCWNDGPVSVDEEKFESKEWKKCWKIAEEMMNLEFIPKTTADHYFNPKLADPSWASKMTVVSKHGNHTFLKGE